MIYDECHTFPTEKIAKYLGKQAIEGIVELAGTKIPLVFTPTFHECDSVWAVGVDIMLDNCGFQGRLNLDGKSEYQDEESCYLAVQAASMIVGCRV